MFRSLLVFALIVGLVSGGKVQAQPPAGGGIGSLIKRLPKPGGEATPAATPTASATRFKPSGKRVLVEKMLKEAQITPAEKKALRDALEAVLQAYEKEAARLKMENDVAGATVFYVAAHYQAFSGTDDLSDAGTVALYRQFLSVMGGDEIKKMTDAQKQDIYEALTVTTAIFLIQYQGATETKNADDIKSLKEQAGKAIKDLLKIEPDRLKINEAGMSVAAGAATGQEGDKPATEKPEPTEKPDSAVPVPGASSLGVNTEGWTRSPVKDSPAVLLTRQLSKGKMLIVYSTAPFKGEGGREKTFWNFWNVATKDIKVDPLNQMPVMGRRLIGDSVALFYSAKVARERDIMSDQMTAYLLEEGDSYYYILARYSPQSVSGLDASLDNVNGYNGNGKDEVYTVTEEFLQGIKPGRTATRKPLFTAAEIQGNWKKIVQVSSASYVTVTGSYAGDASSGFSEELQLLPGNAYKQQVVTVFNGRPGSGNSSTGSYRIEGDRLILTATTTTRKDGVKTDVRRIVAAGKDKDGKPCLILTALESPLSLYGILGVRAYAPLGAK